MYGDVSRLAVEFPRSGILRHQPLLRRPNRDLRPGRETEFGQCGRDVALHRAFADCQESERRPRLDLPLRNERRGVAFSPREAPKSPLVPSDVSSARAAVERRGRPRPRS